MEVKVNGQVKVNVKFKIQVKVTQNTCHYQGKVKINFMVKCKDLAKVEVTNGQGLL